MKRSDEEISAWLDGQLPPHHAARIATELETDDELQGRVASLQEVDDLVRKAVPLDDAVPVELLERLGLGQAPAETNVLPLAFSRPHRRSSAKVTAGGPGTGNRRWWKAAAQVALVACLGLAGAAWLGSADGDRAAPYRTLSAPAASQVGGDPSAIVLFDESVSEAQARTIIRSAGATIAGERTASGAWPIGLDPAESEDILTELRKSEEVLLAESIEGG